MRRDKCVFPANKANPASAAMFRFAASSHHSRLRWHPAVYHFCPLFTSQCLDYKLCFSPGLPLTSKTRWKNLQDSSLCVCVGTPAFADAFVIITVRRDRIGQERRGPHFSLICPGRQRESVSINAWTWQRKGRVFFPEVEEISVKNSMERTN